MSEKAQLEKAISTLEAQRSLLGNDVVETALKPLREQLARLQPSTSVSGQRRLVTVLFADFAGYTSVAEQHDPEVLGEWVRRVWQRLDAVIEAHGGQVYQHVGDGVVALWGAERAREDDAQQAVRAGLALQEALALFRREHPSAPAIEARVGLHTGLVLWSHVGKESAAFGDTMNTAARLQSLAPVGGVTVSHATQARVRSGFQLKACAPVMVKGKQEPVTPHLVLGIRTRETRDSLSPTTVGRMVGRDLEFTILQNAWFDVYCGKGRQLFTLLGEPGIGKSRLLLEFQKWVQAWPEPVTVLHGALDPHSRMRAGALWRELFASHFNLLDSDTPETVQTKWENGFIRDTGESDQERARLLAQVLGLGYATETALRNQPREAATACLAEYFTALSDQQPVVLLIEDLHWADPASLDLLLSVLETAGKSRVLVIATTRDELRDHHQPWLEARRGWHRVLELAPLQTVACKELLAELSGGETTVPEELAEAVVRVSEGNPFYVEELIQMWREEGMMTRLPEGGWSFQTTGMDQRKMPLALASLLQARLDALSSLERRVLLSASVLGRIFWDEALTSLGHSASELIAVLENLVRRGMIEVQEESTVQPAREFAFRHAMLRDAAYQALLLSERRRLHQRAGEWMEKRLSDRLEEFSETLAGHFELAGLNERALPCLRRAAERALRLGAFVETRALARRAVSLLESMPGEREGGSLEFYLLSGEASERLGELTEAREAYSAALVAAELSNHPASLARVHIALCLTFMRQGRHLEAQFHGEKALTLADQQADESLLALAHQHLGAVYNNLGKSEAAEASLERALAFYERTDNCIGASICLNRFGVAAFCRNELTMAETHYRKAMHYAERCGDRYQICMLLGNLGELAGKQGDHFHALRELEHCLNTARTLRARTLHAIFTVVLGDELLATGDEAAAENALRAGIREGLETSQLPTALFGLAKLAGLWARGTRPRGAAQVAGMLLAHPSCDPQVKNSLEDVMKVLHDRLKPEEVTRLLNMGGKQSLDDWLDGLESAAA